MFQVAPPTGGSTLSRTPPNWNVVGGDQYCGRLSTMNPHNDATPDRVKPIEMGLTPTCCDAGANMSYVLCIDSIKWVHSSRTGLVGSFDDTTLCGPSTIVWCIRTGIRGNDDAIKYRLERRLSNIDSGCICNNLLCHDLYSSPMFFAVYYVYPHNSTHDHLVSFQYEHRMTDNQGYINHLQSSIGEVPGSHKVIRGQMKYIPDVSSRADRDDRHRRRYRYRTYEAAGPTLPGCQVSGVSTCGQYIPTLQKEIYVKRGFNAALLIGSSIKHICTTCNRSQAYPVNYTMTLGDSFVDAPLEGGVRTEARFCQCVNDDTNNSYSVCRGEKSTVNYRYPFTRYILTFASLCMTHSVCLIIYYVQVCAIVHSNGDTLELINIVNEGTSYTAYEDVTGVALYLFSTQCIVRSITAGLYLFCLEDLMTYMDCSDRPPRKPGSGNRAEYRVPLANITEDVGQLTICLHMPIRIYPGQQAGRRLPGGRGLGCHRAGMYISSDSGIGLANTLVGCYVSEYCTLGTSLFGAGLITVYVHTGGCTPTDCPPLDSTTDNVQRYSYNVNSKMSYKSIKLYASGCTSVGHSCDIYACENPVLHYTVVVNDEYVTSRHARCQTSMPCLTMYDSKRSATFRYLTCHSGTGGGNAFMWYNITDAWTSLTSIKAWLSRRNGNGCCGYWLRYMGLWVITIRSNSGSSKCAAGI